MPTLRSLTQSRQTVDDTIAWHDPDDVGEWAYDPMFQRDLMASPHFKKP